MKLKTLYYSSEAKQVSVSVEVEGIGECRFKHNLSTDLVERMKKEVELEMSRRLGRDRMFLTD